MNDDYEDDNGDDNGDEEAEGYQFDDVDRTVVSITRQLITKVLRSDLLDSAQQEIVRAVARVFAELPTPSDLNASFMVIGPTREFGDHKIHHYWTVELEDQQIEVKAGGYFWRPSTGGDSFASFRWIACLGFETECHDFVESLGLVDDARPFGSEIDELDLNELGYSISVSLDGEIVGDETNNDWNEDGEDDEEGEEDTTGGEAYTTSKPTACLAFMDAGTGMKPDYGVMIARSGWGSANMFFYSVPLTHLSASGPALFTSMLNKLHDGVEYAVSFDFGPREVAALLAKVSASERKRLEAEISVACPGDVLEFNEPIVVDLETRLGQVQSATREKFIPLVVLRIIQDEIASAPDRVENNTEPKAGGCLVLIGTVTVSGIGMAIHWLLA